MEIIFFSLFLEIGMFLRTSGSYILLHFGTVRSRPEKGRGRAVSGKSFCVRLSGCVYSRWSLKPSVPGEA